MKKLTQKLLSILLALCTVLSFLPTTAYAALDNRVERAISWAISIANDDSHGYDQTHRNGPDYDCSSLVSTAFRQGGFNVSGSCWTGNMEQAFTAVGFKAYAAGSVTLQRGDILLRHDNVWQHVELYIGNNQCVGAHINENGDISGGRTGDQTGHEIDVHSTRSCYFCGGGYARVLRYEGSPSGPSTPTVKEYFSCDVQINTTKGKTVNLYSKPTDSSRKTYFDQGQTAYSTRGAKLSDGSTWYEIQAVDNGKTVTLWLNAGSSGVKVTSNKVAPSLSFSPSSLSMDVSASKTVSVKFTGDGIESIGGTIDGKSLCDVSWGNTNWSTGTTSLTITGKKAGKATITVNLMDKNGKTIYSNNLTVTVNEKAKPSLSFTPSSLSVDPGASKTVSIKYAGDGVESMGGTIDGKSLCDVNWENINRSAGTANLTVTGKKPGKATITVNLMDKNGTILYSKSFGVTVNSPSYTVSYNANGGSNAPATQTKQYDKALTLSSAKPTRTGHTFKGWATSPGASSAQYQPGSSYTNNKNLALYAVWERNKVDNSLTFSPSSLTIDPGASKTVSISFKGEYIEKLHYTIHNSSVCDLNWGSTDWGKGTSSLTVIGKNPGTTTVTVYFLDDEGKFFFSKDFNVTVSSPSYTVSYNANGGNGAPSSQTKQYNKTLTLSSTKPTRDGYTFVGWAESSSASSAQYQSGGSYTSNKNLTLYAVWKLSKVDPSLTFSSSSLSMDLGTSKTVSIKFAGDGIQSIGGTINGQSLCDVSWGTTNWSAGTTSLTVTGKKEGKATITVNLMDKDGKTIYSKSFTATFVDPTYTVSYNANGGSGAPSSQTKQYNKILTLSSSKPTRDGYNFIGWAESSNASSAQVQYHPGDSFTENKSLTLYAVWTAAKPDHQHNLSYNHGVLSTCTEGGTQEYWSCAGCGKRFADAFANSEIVDVHLEPLGHNYADGICTRCGIADPSYPHTPVTPINGVHFPKQRTYAQGYFADVYSNQWFTTSVAAAYEFGLMQGKSNRVFDPYGSVTLAEAITMACRIHSIYTKGYEDIPQSEGAWYQGYLDYAYANGIVNWSDYNSSNVSSAATRAQFAQIMAKTLPEEGFPAINSVADNAIPDVLVSATFAPAVYQLYRAGILSGGDARGTFSPGTYITRAESAVIVARIAESENRSHFTLA